MRTPADTEAWEDLQRELEAWLTKDNAHGLVTELQRTGWQAPTPTWKRTKPARTEASKKYIAACREAIRKANVHH